MNYKKVKNGIQVSVKDWEKSITLTDMGTGIILKRTIFSDHLQAIYFAKELTKSLNIKK